MRPLTFYFAKDVAFGGFFGNKDLAEDKSIDDPGDGQMEAGRMEAGQIDDDQT
ncbi:995_t:CDS:2 [Entrophospora sp. SA101]|nr:995_t:CDS:2 [Entrophospora sp. SA101]